MEGHLENCGMRPSWSKTQASLGLLFFSLVPFLDSNPRGSAPTAFCPPGRWEAEQSLTQGKTKNKFKNLTLVCFEHWALRSMLVWSSLSQLDFPTGKPALPTASKSLLIGRWTGYQHPPPVCILKNKSSILISQVQFPLAVS